MNHKAQAAVPILLLSLQGCALNDPWQPTGPIYPIGGDVKPPRVLVNGDDRASLGSERLTKGGCASVKLIVDEQGLPRQVELLQSPSPILGAWAVRSAQAFVFQPATRAGSPVAVRLHVDSCISTY